MSAELRQEVIATAIAMNRSGINQGLAGNVSARCDDGMLITPSGMAYEALKAADIVFVNAAGEPRGERLPSSEWRFHLDIYRHREDAGAVVHAHPSHAATLACMGRPIPAFHYMVAIAGGRNIRCADYATPGSQALSDHVLAALRERKACLMANHGMVCLESGLQKALALAVEVEQLARMYWQCLQIGDPELLSDEEMATMVGIFRRYGANAQSRV
jgi:L-fuculose-phosphate aldolase